MELNTNNSVTKKEHIKSTIQNLVSSFSRIQHSTFDIRYSARRGFTLIEMIVSLGLFTVILFVATSAFLTIVSVDRKSRVVRIATDNMNLALEDMSRRIKTGAQYYCGGIDGGGTADCPLGDTSIFFTAQDLSRLHYHSAVGVECGVGYRDTQGCILRADLAPMPVTSPEINITSLKYIVSGSTPFLSGDKKQPMVVVVIDGEIESDTQNPAQKSAFKLQTTITQRVYDN